MFGHDEKVSDALDRLQMENNLVTDYIANTPAFLTAEGKNIIENYTKNLQNRDKKINDWLLTQVKTQVVIPLEFFYYLT